MLGWLNRRLGVIETIFVAYPATWEHAAAFVYHWQLERMRWRPIPAGFFVQDGRVGLIFGISNTDDDFYHRGEQLRHDEELRVLIARTERIRDLVGARRVSFAGILPGVLASRGLFDAGDALDVTVEAVIQAEAQVRKTLGYAENSPLILLGGKGFVGRRLTERLAHRSPVIVDVVDGGETWPHHLQGRPAILVNLTKKAALADYIPLWWPELALLNEVYPEPSETEIAALAAIGAPTFHVVGVQARAVPPFPRAYQGGVPCCAAWPNENMTVIVRRLSPPDGITPPVQRTKATDRTSLGRGSLGSPGR